MADISRRRALGLTGGAFGLAACNTTGAGATPEPESGTATFAYDGDVSFDHGVASGDPLPDRVILWTRVTPLSGAGPIPVTVRIFDPEQGDGPVDTIQTTTTEGRDYTVKVDAEGLAPGKAYTYEFEVQTLGGGVTSPRGRTKTTAAAGDTAPVTFAFVSCSNWPFGFFNVYRDIAARDDLDAVIHLGDYFYEYGIDGYGGEAGQSLGRVHTPVTETVTLGDYRTRHAQYKTDPDLQAAHAAAPWLCTWDDHESTNNSYRTGAQNHNPEENEGDWSDRKQVAVQAYLEWMPVRDPNRGQFRESIYRAFDFGDVATVFCLESRLTGRSDEISWFTEFAGKTPEEIPATAMTTMQRVADPARTMLGAEQETWLANGFATSTGAGKAWQVLANQTVMANVVPPNFQQTLSEDAIAAVDNPFVERIVAFSQMGLPWNLDAWDGFPAARERLFSGAADAGARLVTFTGDTHTAWANNLHDANGDLRGVEFGCTSVTSPGLGTTLPVPDLGQQFVDANEDVVFHDPFGSGYTLVELTTDTVKADFVKVSTIVEETYTAETVARFESERAENGLTALKPV
ncbi:MAG: alkaline phosphatase D family protein [Pseudomonadota bacterium]